MTPEWFRHFANALGRPVLDMTGGVPLCETTAEERAGLMPPWMCRELIGTDASRARLHAWTEAGSPTPSADDVVRRLRCTGDDSTRDVLQHVLLELPPPVTVHVLDNLNFYGVGADAIGYFIATAMPPGDVLRVIVLDGHERNEGGMASLIKHEVAHAWLIGDSARPIPAEELHNEVDARLLAAAARPDAMRALLGEKVRVEQQADDLAAAWGGAIRCSAVGATRKAADRARQLAETYGRG